MTKHRAIGMAAYALALVACSSSTTPTGSSGASSTLDAGGAAHDAAAAGDVDAGGGGRGNQGSDASGALPEAGVGASIDATIVLDVPAGFTGTPRELDVVLVQQLPVAGPPSEVLLQQKSPAVTAGSAMTVHGDATGVAGSYYVVVVLYMQGGGTFLPKDGVDYVAESSAKVTFTGAPIDLGTMQLQLAGGDAGP